MSRPKKVKVGPFVFSIEFSKKKVEDAAITRSHGVTDFDALLIAIQPALKPLEQETLIHEILHAICLTSGLSVKLEDNQEEEIVTTMAPYLIDVLRNNKPVTRFLLED